MLKNHCPTCGSSDVVQQTVNDCLRAADQVGRTFEVVLKVPVWRCRACKLCWQGEEALAAKEAAYQHALVSGHRNVLPRNPPSVYRRQNSAST